MSHVRLRLALSLVVLSACGGAPGPDAGDPGAAPKLAPPASAAPVDSGARAPAPSASPPDERAPAERGPQQVAASGPASFDVKIVAAEAPPFARVTKKRADVAAPGKRAPKLTKISEAKRHPAEEERWFEDNGIVLPAFGLGELGLAGPRPDALPPVLRGLPFALAIRQAEGDLLALYGAPGDGGRYVVGLDVSGKARFALDFAAYTTAPVTAPGDERYVTQGVRWAALERGVLYVSSSHRTYAKSSGGKNAFLTALDPMTGEIRWQSDPLVSNAHDFLIWDGFLLTGYGFTAEPDHLFVLDPTTGATLARTAVRSGPEYLARKEGRLLVRTYDTDYVFGVE